MTLPLSTASTARKLLPKQKIIGFMISYDLENNFHVPIWRAVSETAQENNFSLITYLNSNVWYSSTTINRNETIYKQINQHNLDGMISFDFGIPYVAEKLTHFDAAPNIIINYPRKNYLCLTISQKEIKLVVEHLIKVHHKKKIIYISGNKGNFEAEARLEAFKEAMSENNLPFPPEYLFYGEFGDVNCGARFITEAIEKRHLDFDAVVCANDTMAFSVFSGLKEHGLSVPYDVAVTGFDDDAHARSSLPPMTTVRSSFYDVARHGSLKLVRMINGEKISAGVEVTPTQLVIRRSCGCMPDSVHDASIKTSVMKAKKKLQRFDAEELHRELAELLGDKEKLLPGNWHLDLWEALIKGVEKDDVDSFIQHLDLLQREFIKVGLDLEIWQQMLSALSRYFITSIDGKHKKFVAFQEFINQARVFSAEMFEQKLIRQAIDLEADYTKLLSCINRLVNTRDMESLLNLLVEDIQPNLDIPGIYLVTFEGSSWPAKKGRLILASNDHKRIDLGTEGAVFDVENLLPDNILDSSRRHNLLVAPLSIGEENLGYVIYDVNHLGGFYSQLTSQLANAVRGAFLYQQREKLIVHIADSAEKLSTVSDKLTNTVNGTKKAMNQIAESMGQVAKGASDQAEVVNQTALSIDQMSNASQNIAEDARTSNNFAAEAAKEAEQGKMLGEATVQNMVEIKKIVGEASLKVREMSDHSSQISTIVETIEDIASQTNLLALNAAIEAARAGEHGKGFAVVADEVRKLAEKSAVSAKEIAKLVKTIQNSIDQTVISMAKSDTEVAAGVTQADKSNESLNTIHQAANQVYLTVSEIARSAGSIAQQAQQMSSAVENIASVSEENTSATEEVNASVMEINATMVEMADLTQTIMDMATTLSDLVNQHQED